MPEGIETVAKRAIQDGVFPGCTIALVRTGERFISSYGTLALNGEPVRDDTVYDLASVTKSIPVSSLVLKLISEHVLELHDLVRKWIPELQNDHAATIEDLLCYRVHGEPMSLIAHLAPREIKQHIFASGFAELPGAPHYSNLPAYLLGIILERASGKPLDVLAHDTFFAPLNMSSTFFGRGREYTDISVYPAIAPTETEEAGDVVGIVHDESARAFAREGIAVGHAGLFSTASDMATFLEALLAGSFPYIVKGAHKGLGWELNHGAFMGTHFGPRTFGKSGFTGTSVLCDTDRGVGLVILSNRTYPTRPTDNSAINAVRAGIANLVLGQKR